MAFTSPTPIAVALGALLFCSHAWSATLIEQKGIAVTPKQGNAAAATQPQSSKILLDATHARMEGGQTGQYMLMDFANHKMLMINPKQKQAVDISAIPKMPAAPNGAQKQPEAKPVKAELVKVGSGPQVAGYATDHYQVKADAKVCSNEFISADAMKVAYVSAFTQAMHTMAEERRQAMVNMPFFQQDPCAKAAEQVSGDMLKLGMLMRSEDAGGQLRQEIVSIKADAPATADSFSVPADFSVLTPQQMMQRAMQNMMQQKGASKPGEEAKPGETNAAPQITPEMRQKMQEEMARRVEEARQKGK